MPHARSGPIKAGNTTHVSRSKDGSEGLLVIDQVVEVGVAAVFAVHERGGRRTSRTVGLQPRAAHPWSRAARARRWVPVMLSVRDIEADGEPLGWLRSGPAGHVSPLRELSLI